MNATQHPVSEDDGFFHIVPLGEFPHAESGKVQVLDRPAHAAILRNFQADAAQPRFAGKLVDQDHFSYDLNKPSTAFGWLKELQPRGDGLWGRIEFSDEGEAAVRNRRYKFVSPVFTETQTLGSNRVRPLRLDSVGLTNNPNFKGMEPLMNRIASTPGGFAWPDPDPMLPLIAAEVVVLLANREPGHDWGQRLLTVGARYPIFNRAINRERLYGNRAYHHCFSLQDQDRARVESGAKQLREKFRARDEWDRTCRTDLPLFTRPTQIHEYARNFMESIGRAEGLTREAAFARMEELHPLLFINLCLNADTSAAQLHTLTPKW